MRNKRKEDEYILTNAVLQSVCEYLLTHKSREEELVVELPFDYKITKNTRSDISGILSNYQPTIDGWVFMLSNKDSNKILKLIKRLLASIYANTVSEYNDTINDHLYCEIDECEKTKHFIFKINACTNDKSRPIRIPNSLDLDALDNFLEHLGFEHSGIVRLDNKPKEYFTISHRVPDVLELTNPSIKFKYGCESFL